MIGTEIELQEKFDNFIAAQEEKIPVELLDQIYQLLYPCTQLTTEEKEKINVSKNKENSIEK